MRQLLFLTLAALCAPARLCSAITDPMVKWQGQAAPNIQALDLSQESVLVVHAEGLMALGIPDGKVRWRRNHDSGLKQARLCPGVVLVADSQGTLSSLRPADGSAVWKTALPIQGKPRISCLHDAVLASGDGDVVGVGLKDGKILWNYSGKSATLSASAGSRAYLASKDSLTVLDAGSGKALSSRTVAPGAALLASENPDSLCLIYPDKIMALHPRSLATLWARTLAVDAASPPAAQKDRLLVADQEGMLRILDLKDGKEKGRYYIGQPVSFAPEIAADAVYLAAGNFLYGLDSHGKELWRNEIGRVVAAPIYRDGVLYAANASGRVLALTHHIGRQDLDAALASEFGPRPAPRQARVTHFMVRRELERLAERLSAQDAAPTGSKPVIAVLMIEDLNGERGWLAAGLTDMLIDAFAASDRYTVVERTRLDQVAQELKLSLSGAVDRDKALRLGRLVAAERLVTGSVIAVGEFYELSARMTETETGILLKSGTVQIRKSLMGKP